MGKKRAGGNESIISGPLFAEFIRSLAVPSVFSVVNLLPFHGLDGL